MLINKKDWYFLNIFISKLSLLYIIMLWIIFQLFLSHDLSIFSYHYVSNRVFIIKKRKTYESLVTKNGGKKYHSKYYIIATSKILETTLQHQRKRSIFPKFFKLKTQTKLLKSIFEEGNPVHRDTIAPRYIFNGYIFR